MQLVQEDFVVRELDHDEMVRDKLVEWYGRRPSLWNIEVSMLNGIAILRGRITTQRDRALAVDLAMGAGADDVQDELLVTWPLAA
ncbi:MAG: BON domain-containing protein [Nitrospirae bacterium]|nr:BON domain-containing protein [Nitrospirota bacterium]